MSSGMEPKNLFVLRLQLKSSGMFGAAHGGGYAPDHLPRLIWLLKRPFVTEIAALPATLER
jgi:hypothetical protein